MNSMRINTEKRRRRRNYFDLIGFFFFPFSFSYPIINFSKRDVNVAVVGSVLGFNGVTGDNGLEKREISLLC